MTRGVIVVVFCLLGLAVPPSARAALQFNFTVGGDLAALQGSDPTLYNNVINGFTAAGQRFSNIFADNVTVQVTIDYKSLGLGILGQAGSQSDVYSYANIRNALIGDLTSADDFTATASLPNVPSLSFLTNNSAGAVVLDNDGSNNNSFLDVNRANARALGLIGNGDTNQDASITFSSNFTWDFDPINGIDGGAFDFVGVATHEIGHAMGFVSGVDTVDFLHGSGTNLNGFAVFSVLDLYRYSADGQRNLAFGGTPYTSLDGGATQLGLMSTGAFNGDGRQASHWKDGLGIGIMDPTFGFGELGVISGQDIRGFDIIGWTLHSQQAVPEPGTLSLFGLGLVALAGYYRRLRKPAAPMR